MPLFFFIIGFILVDSGFRGNAQALYSQFASDAKGFVALFAVIVILGAVGVSSAMRPVAKGMLFLVFVVFFVRNGNQIVSGIESAVNASASVAPGTSDIGSSVSSTNSGAGLMSGVAQGINSVSSDINQVSNDVNTVSNTVQQASGIADDIMGIVGMFG